MRALLAVAAVMGYAHLAQAQNSFIYKPVDANKLLVQPTDAASGASTGIFRTATRAVANAVENNGFVKTINNLLGRRAKDPVPQAGYSALPHPSTYQSSSYQSSLQPAMPMTQPYGSTPNVVLPQSPSARK